MRFILKTNVGGGRKSYFVIFVLGEISFSERGVLLLLQGLLKLPHFVSGFIQGWKTRGESKISSFEFLILIKGLWSWNEFKIPCVAPVEERFSLDLLQAIRKYRECALEVKCGWCD